MPQPLEERVYQCAQANPWWVLGSAYVFVLWLGIRWAVRRWR